MMHIINFAHGAIYMLGAFVVYYFFAQWGAPYFFTFLLAMVLLGVFGFVVERCIYRTIKGGIEPTLVALLALTTFLQAAGYPIFGPLDKDVPSVFTGTHNILGVLVSAERLVIIPAAAVFARPPPVYPKPGRWGHARHRTGPGGGRIARGQCTLSMPWPLPWGLPWRPPAAAHGADLLDPMMGGNPAEGVYHHHSGRPGVFLGPSWGLDVGLRRFRRSHSPGRGTGVSAEFCVHHPVTVI
jgi:hypothetical protein